MSSKSVPVEFDKATIRLSPGLVTGFLLYWRKIDAIGAVGGDDEGRDSDEEEDSHGVDPAEREFLDLIENQYEVNSSTHIIASFIIYSLSVW